MLTHFAQGVAVGGGLIIAIGAQNVFVLTQGIQRNHHLMVAGVCFLCDALLIAAGVGGMGAIVASQPVLAKVMAWLGAGFLFWYGLGSLRSAIKGESLQAKGAHLNGKSKVLAATLGVTLLNPHVYLDTVVLLGSIGGQMASDGRLSFGMGAALASLLWFFSLSLGGAMLAPVLSRPKVWRCIDFSVCAVMWFLACNLVMTALAPQA